MPQPPAVLGALIVGAIAVASAAVHGQALPPGRGADVLKARCVSCHESDLITQQRLSAAAWGRSIDKMIRWGAALEAEDRKVLEEYLASHYGPRPMAAHAASDAGQAIYKRACTACHEADLIEQQRLTRTGWTRSVEKMMRWGAAVTDADKDALVDYLASRYGPR